MSNECSELGAFKNVTELGFLTNKDPADVNMI